MASLVVVADHDHQLERVHGLRDSYFGPVHHGMRIPLVVLVG
jgi:hypothetical protein